MEGVRTWCTVECPSHVAVAEHQPVLQRHFDDTDQKKCVEAEEFLNSSVMTEIIQNYHNEEQHVESSGQARLARAPTLCPYKDGTDDCRSDEDKS